MSDTGPGRARKAEPAVRRDAILDAALTVFAERGFEAARLDDVAAQAGVAKGTLYLYFKDKEALFRELVELNRLNLRRAQAEAIDVEAEPLRQIRQGAEASVRIESAFSF